MNKNIYEVLKVLSLVVLPALATFYVTLASSWGWGHTEQIVATLAGLATVLGVLVKTLPPYDGTAYIEPGADLDDPDKFNVDLRGYLGDPAKLQDHKIVRLKVVKKAA